MTDLTPLETSVINQVSTQLSIADPQWLTNLIAFETGGTFDPAASNPRSSAKGLIQFLDSTALGMGFESSQDLILKYPDFESQMKGPVVNYLKTYAPYPQEYKLYMAVFYPAAIKYPADTTFKKIYYDRISDNTKAERAYKAFANANPGIRTPQDYVNFVKKKAGISTSTGTGIGIIAVTAVIALFLFGRKIRSKI